MPFSGHTAAVRTLRDAVAPRPVEHGPGRGAMGTTEPAAS